MSRLTDKIDTRSRRKKHVRSRISGTADRPRMTVFRSNKNISVQVIDDEAGKTLVSVTTQESELKGLRSNLKGGAKVGKTIGARLKAKKIKQIVFDRNGYKYHGVVKAIADGAREAGIDF